MSTDRDPEANHFQGRHRSGIRRASELITQFRNMYVYTDQESYEDGDGGEERSAHIFSFHGVVPTCRLQLSSGCLRMVGRRGLHWPTTVR